MGAWTSNGSDPVMEISCGRAGFIAAQQENLIRRCGLEKEYLTNLEDIIFNETLSYADDLGAYFVYTMLSTADARENAQYRLNASSRTIMASGNAIQKASKEIDDRAFEFLDKNQFTKVKEPSVLQHLKNNVIAAGFLKNHSAKTAVTNLAGMRLIESNKDFNYKKARKTSVKPI
jgi:hypothetical protein